MTVNHWGDHNREWVTKIDTGFHDSIHALLVDEESETVFIGGKDQSLKQFNLKNGKLVKEYNLGMGGINCLSSFKHLLFVGGNAQFSLIDMGLREVVTNIPVNTSIQNISSSQFWAEKWNNKIRVSLAISGSNSFFLLFYNLIIVYTIS